jgi:hypothetical protein
MSVVEIAQNYLNKKGLDSMRVLHSRDIVCSHRIYTPRMMRYGSIWLSKRRLNFLKRANAIILAIDKDDGTVTEICAKDVPDGGGVVSGVRVKVVDADNVRVSIPRKLKLQLDKISTDTNKAIKLLLDIYNTVVGSHPITQSNVLMSIIGAIKALRDKEYFNVVRKLERHGEVNLVDLSEEEVRIVKELASYRVVFIDNRPNGEFARLLCKFVAEDINNEVLIRIGYSYDFCRFYCNRFESCPNRAEDKVNYYGFRMRFSVDDFLNKNPEELIGIWLSQCSQRF